MKPKASKATKAWQSKRAKDKTTKAEKKAQTLEAGSTAEEAFPMVNVINEQIRTTIPQELVDSVNKAKSKK